MKSILASIALVAVALPTGSALIELSGVAMPALLSAEVGLGLFVAAFASMILATTYASPRRVAIRARAGRCALLPAREAFVSVCAPIAAARAHSRPPKACC